jgi:nucleobase:cation symporter-1, NCS1 family
MKDKSRLIANEVKFGFLPANKQEREFGFWDLLFVQSGFGIAAWCFLVGGLTGSVLNATDSIATILFGNAFPVLLIVPIAVLFARYGVDTFIGFRSALGYRGSDIFFVIFAVLNLGWISIACFMVGESAAKLLWVLGAGEFWTARETGAPIFAIASFFIALFVASQGPVAIKWFTRIGVPSILLVLIGLIIVVAFKKGPAELFAISPVNSYDSYNRSIATALEWNVGLGFSWLPYIGQYSRLAKSENAAFSGSFFAYGVILNIAAIMGALTSLLVASLYPTDWMVAIGGKILGILGLILLILGNVTSAVLLTYSQGISFKTVFPKQKWWIALATTVPAAILMSSPSFYDAYGRFLSMISYVMAVFGGIVIMDFFVVKKQRISLRDLYDRKGIYTYWKGINPSAAISLILGTAMYWWMYNPIQDTAHSLFNILGAGIPAYFTAGIVYYICSTYLFYYDKKQLIKASQEKSFI